MKRVERKIVLELLKNPHNSLARLRDSTGYCLAYVDSSLRLLRATGVVELVRKGGGQTLSVYRVNLDADAIERLKEDEREDY